MKTLLVALMCLPPLAASPPAGSAPVASPSAASGPGERRDPEALEVARKTLEAMGGEAAFASLRTLHFDFIVHHGGKELARFRHVWDRHDGRYRVEGKTKNGQNLVVLFNTNEKDTGRAWVDGRELAGPDLDEKRDFGYDRFINDTYWLLMPAKMLDPGVNLAYEGEAEEGGRKYRVVRLTFQKVGLTPGDTYWAYVSPESGLMERWDFVLQDQKTKDRTTFIWEDWKPVGGVRLSRSKRTPDGSTVILFENVSGSTQAEDTAFAPPTPAG